MSRRFCFSVHSANFFGPSSSSNCARALGAAARLADPIRGSARRLRAALLGLVALRVRIAVHDHVAEEVQQLRRAVAARLELEQLRRRVDHRRRRLAAAEDRVMRCTFSRNGMFVFTPRMRNSRSARSMRSSAVSKVGAARRDLHQQRIVKRRDHRARVAHARIEPDAEAARAAIRDDLAVVRRELVLRVLGRDAALDRRSHCAESRPAPAAPTSAPCSFVPCAMRICERTRSMPVICSVTVCSTWMRGFISMKNHSCRVQIVEELDRARVVVADLLARSAPRRRTARGAPSRSSPTDGAISTTF